MQAKVKLAFAQGTVIHLDPISERHGVVFTDEIHEVTAQIEKSPAFMINPRGTDALREAAQIRRVLQRELGPSLTGCFTMTAPNLQAAQDALVEIIDIYQEKVGVVKAPADLTI